MKCPKCGYEFVVDVEFEERDDAYCHCPRCAREFKPSESASASDRVGGPTNRMSS
jgi:hypothetical protein